MNTPAKITSAVLAASLLGVVVAAPAQGADRTVDVVPLDGEIHLSWEDTGAEVYDVVRDGVVVATVTGNEYYDQVVNSNPYTYDIVANGGSIDPLGTLTAVAADTSVAADGEIRLYVQDYFDGGVRLYAQLPSDNSDLAAVQVHAGGELLGRYPVHSSSAITMDVFGLGPSTLDSLELILEDVVGNTKVATYPNGRGPEMLISLNRLKNLPVPPINIRAEACTDGTTVTWDTLGSHDGRFAVKYGDGSGWFTVDEPRVTIPADVTTFQLATRNDWRISEFTPPIANSSSTNSPGLPTCLVTVTEPSQLEGVTVNSRYADGSAFADLSVAGNSTYIYIDGESGVAGARITGGELEAPIYVGGSSEGKWIRVPIKYAEVGTDGTLTAEIIGFDGQTIHTTEVPIKGFATLDAAEGGEFDVDVLADHTRIFAAPVAHDRQVLRDGEPIGYLPANTSAASVTAHDTGHVHSYQLRGVGTLPLSSDAVVVTR